jgi:tetrahydroxynaphthalene reductase
MDAMNGHVNGEAHMNGDTSMNGEAPMNGHTNGHAAAEPEITRIRGPLGLGSASLAGKVALVTGSGA